MLRVHQHTLGATFCPLDLGFCAALIGRHLFPEFVLTFKKGIFRVAKDTKINQEQEAERVLLVINSWPMNKLERKSNAYICKTSKWEPMGITSPVKTVKPNKYIK